MTKGSNIKHSQTRPGKDFWCTILFIKIKNFRKKVIKFSRSQVSGNEWKVYRGGKTVMDEFPLTDVLCYRRRGFLVTSPGTIT